MVEGEVLSVVVTQFNAIPYEGAIAVAAGCPGDFNDDGLRDFGDWTIFQSAYSSRSGDANFNGACDLDGNDMVDFTDFVLFGSYYGVPCP